MTKFSRWSGAAWVLLIWGCNAGIDAETDPASNPTAEAESAEADLGSREAALTQCTDGQTKVIGCRYVCKPCRIGTCEDGHWVYESMDWGEECEPHPWPGPATCQADANGFCPAECHSCG
ncbi:MAG TPA: hypothetical protein VFQ61_39195 [Polyangiaceae bacterium]|nr:hypothetical protein [Polyangiaceae bacterium]